jgi:hypothetical protein
LWYIVQAQTRAGLFLQLARAVVDLCLSMPHPSQCRQRQRASLTRLRPLAVAVRAPCRFLHTYAHVVVWPARRQRPRVLAGASQQLPTAARHFVPSLQPPLRTGLLPGHIVTGRLHNRPSPDCARSSSPSHSLSHCYCHQLRLSRTVANHTCTFTASTRSRAIQICNHSRTTLWPL